ncbi:5-oxoprolinase/urea amidolyase family protein [Klugiella xanthotipulae]|uniref:KipI family sensor histidine kinase inhibitor n=1 Tax=Klugiella xanthotipulae TaxID=244735 RepID=A0A543HH22_9MICO|nr:urea amidolyase family protein [Klugiella xanthotipulae]TQM57628.1 KipI family sensor histidine kinase inhibitor [Klugiella xanthotipulae]
MRFLPVNTDALLVELDGLEQTLSLLDSLTARPISGVVELVPAARTLLVSYRPSAVSAAEIVADIRARGRGERLAATGRLVTVPVRYDGADLVEVAGILGVTPDEVIAMHTESEYTVAFTGFAPGFAYLTGGHPALDVPRRLTPRTRIPAGAVGLAGTFSGVYPQASPGGWQIIGVTDERMWDVAREVPALLQPGFRVRFVEAAASVRSGVSAVAAESRPTVPERSAAPAPPAAPALRVQATGIQTLYQDLGRRGRASQGVSAAGALDHSSLRVANRLVGNASDTACLEVVDGGLSVVSVGDTLIAVTGADAPLTVTLPDGGSVVAAPYQPIVLGNGEALHLGTPTHGIRSYLAVRGGFAVPPVLGSLSTDTLSTVGPAPVAPGDVLPVRAVLGAADAVALEAGTAPNFPTANEEVVLDVVWGPRTDWFTPEALRLLCSQAWTVTPQSNRVGLRLAGDAALARDIAGELPSEGTVVGSIQVPPNGQPVLFLADHPLTGGYPVIGAVASHHLNLAGQIPLGARIRFHPVTAFGELG